MTMFSHTADRIVCPYSDCGKNLSGAAPAVFSQDMPVATLKCPYCSRHYMVRIMAYRTTTLDRSEDG